MTIFQKLFWLQQMGVHYLCAEEPHGLSGRKVRSVGAEKSLTELDKKLTSSKSALSATATHPMGGTGMVPAEVMCILEMPSATEDRTGTPLSGEEGDLLKKMLAAVGLSTQIQTYVAYLSPWRAPGARVLTGVETQECLALLKDRIDAVNPDVLLLFGLPVVQALLGVPLGQARTKAHAYQGIRAFATFAPGFLIKNPDYKKGAWEDLKKLQTFLQGEK